MMKRFYTAIVRRRRLVLAVFVLLAFEVSLSANVIVDVANKAVRWVQRRSRKLLND
mgnify:CR=1 FL=1